MSHASGTQKFDPAEALGAAEVHLVGGQEQAADAERERVVGGIVDGSSGKSDGDHNGFTEKTRVQVDRGKIESEQPFEQAGRDAGRLAGELVGELGAPETR